MTNMDKLYEAVEARGPVCVGLDTDFSYLPADFVDSTLSKGENIVRFNKKLIGATKAVAGCYKVQIAYYESLGLACILLCVTYQILSSFLRRFRLYSLHHTFSPHSSQCGFLAVQTYRPCNMSQ